MTPTPEHRTTAGQPPLAELMARFLNRRSEAVAGGLASTEPGDVELHEAVPVQSVDPKQAWDEGTAVLEHYGVAVPATAPADWSSLVAAQPSHTGLAFAIGNYPQMVRDLAPLYREAEDLAVLPMPEGPAVAVTAVPATEFPAVLLALGTLRLARQWDAADALIQAHAGRVPTAFAAAWANEEAAISWHRGRKDAAARLWQQLPETVPVLFNRGMAALFSGQPDKARNDLRQAVAQLPEASGWHHLGRLYLALAGG
jgi:tetratricopeptide (TPR) repeat protein